MRCMVCGTDTKKDEDVCSACGNPKSVSELCSTVKMKSKKGNVSVLVWLLIFTGLYIAYQFVDFHPTENEVKQKIKLNSRKIKDSLIQLTKIDDRSGSHTVQSQKSTFSLIDKWTPDSVEVHQALLLPFPEKQQHSADKENKGSDSSSVKPQEHKKMDSVLKKMDKSDKLLMKNNFKTGNSNVVIYIKNTANHHYFELILSPVYATSNNQQCRDAYIWFWQDIISEKVPLKQLTKEDIHKLKYLNQRVIGCKKTNGEKWNFQ